MPELPDITVYVKSLDAKLRGATLQRVRVMNPFLLRTATPQRLVHLQQAIDQQDHLAEEVRKAKLTMKEPARG